MVCFLPPQQASDTKREQFRRYLEKAGVVDSLTSGMTRFCLIVLEVISQGARTFITNFTLQWKAKIK